MATVEAYRSRSPEFLAAVESGRWAGQGGG
jgi:hypothetical protein